MERLLPSGARSAQLDASRTARLWLDDSTFSLDARTRHDMPIRSRPPAPTRLLQTALKRRCGPARMARDTRAVEALRTRVLASSATGPPRFLVRVDEFPHYRAWDEPRRYGTGAFLRFHEIMRAAGVPYLIAGLPRLSRDPLNPAGRESRSLDDDERLVLARLPGEGVEVALHGRDHRTRFASPRRRSELSSLDPARTAALLDTAVEELREATGERARVFVPPYNRFSANQWSALAHRFSVVCGGPETIRTLGIQPTPRWLGNAVYLPAYAPFYGHAAQVIAAAQRSLERASGLWTPIVLHWGWEADAGWRELEHLAELIAPQAADWQGFLEAVERSR